MSRRAWSSSLLLLLVAPFAIGFGARFPWARTLDLLTGCDWPLLAAAAGCNLVSLAAKGGAWHRVLRRLGSARLSTAQTATFLGAAVGSISVSVSGEAARAHFAAGRDGLSFRVAAAGLLLTRAVEAVGLLLFLALALTLAPPWPGAGHCGLVLGALTAAVVTAYHWILGRRIQSNTGRRWHTAVVRLTQAAGRGGLGGALLLATCNWLAQWLTYHWSIAATHVSVTPAVSLVALGLANLIGIFRLTPANIGVMQGSLMLGMRGFGIGSPDALAAGLVLQAVQILPVLGIGMTIMGLQGLRKLAVQSSEVG